MAHVKKALGLGALLVAAPQPPLQQLLFCGGGGAGAAGGGELRTVAVCAGSGSSLLDRALQAGADVFLTGENSSLLRKHCFILLL